MNRKAIAEDTVQIGERGTYTAPGGKMVSVAALLRRCLDGTVGYEPDVLTHLHDAVLSRPPRHAETRFSVANETTLDAAHRLTEAAGGGRVGVLNFASAKNPGGGFLGGAQAQEESLARSSGLYHSLRTCPDHYAFHRQLHTCLYSDRMIYSPDCPVFRRDNGSLLEDPYCVDFLTSPAPNAGAIRRNTPEDVSRIPSTLRERTAKLLALFADKHCDTLILGAWGCGVFRNDPALVAGVFAEYLVPGSPFWGRFAAVHFAVLDRSERGEIIAPFHARFAAPDTDAREAA